MIKSGKGGANTQTGVKYEADVDLATFISKLKGYNTVPNDKYSGTGKRSNAFIVKYENKPVAWIFKQNTIYNFLKSEHDLDISKVVTMKLVPDDSIYVFLNNTLFIIEVKRQVCSGSVDEKLQTCDFKKKQWKKIVSRINWNIEYVYLLSDWFRQDRYKDVLDYIINVGCSYYFEYIDLHKIGLPVPKN